MARNDDYKRRKTEVVLTRNNKNEAYCDMLRSPVNEKAKDIFKRPAFSIGKTEKEN